VHSETLAEMDIGSGPIPLLKVTDVGALQECWAGAFTQDVTGTVWNVTLEIGAYGQVTASTGFPGPVTGRIFTESGLLAGHLEIAYGPARPDEIMFLDTETDGATWMSGTYGMDCVGGCNGGTFYLHLCAASGVGDGPPAGGPASLRNYPNPFNPRTTIAFTVRDGSPITLSVFDAAGRRVRTLLRDAALPRGPATVAWDGRDGRGRPLPSGTYVYRLQAGRRVETGRMTLLR
jgi:hypothetical protein